ncbi:MULTISPECIES: bacteriophage CI repressor [unclassified Lentimonas]|uniref:bacteriophage CI repressor n=1 Tax=unclassified Lentimonas TaxID=2630993 RepID=UPI001325CD6E|nr:MULTISPECIES: bacteriophage CI repressor [unclassified Lentimonas]CAA6677383.1 Unannotated [Lentimonas sp. CC4]CAA6686928.1 Unannotated [Lentimonas sp. CC6]CAA6690111.1 Unannotated [Lentimonas sp. CC19]CAA6690927.1 Unannotated [Lentimonas sp. CC10]CAA7070721.1 Unannotated [Lentimonas sp. CC11]
MNEINTETVPESFKERLRQIAAPMGGIKSLSELSGVPHGTLQKYVLKKGAIEPSRKWLTKIVLATDCNAHWLLTGEGGLKTETALEADTKNEVKIPLFSEISYNRCLNCIYDFDERDELIRSARSEMFNEHAVTFNKQEARELFGADCDNIVAFKYKRATSGGGSASRRLYFIDLNLRTPEHGVEMCVLHNGTPYLFRALEDESHDLYLVDESKEHPLHRMPALDELRKDNIVGQVVGSILGKLWS